MILSFGSLVYGYTSNLSSSTYRLNDLGQITDRAFTPTSSFANGAIFLESYYSVPGTVLIT